MTSLGANQLIHCGLATSYGIFVNTGSGNVLVPNGTMLLPDPMMTNCPLDIQDLMTTSVPEAGGHLNIKMPSYQYRDSRAKDRTVSPTVLSLTWESPLLGKTVFTLRRGPGIYNLDNKSHCTVSLIQRYCTCFWHQCLHMLMKLYSKFKHFIQENTFGNIVGKMAAILFISHFY